MGIGSNIGNKKINIEKAKFLIQKFPIKIIKISSIYETFSWPNSNHPKYYNIILKIMTNIDPLSLLGKIKAIEKKFGRRKTKKNYPRKCDIDIIDYNGQILSIKHNTELLQIPHPRLHHRNFVLIPLHEVSSNWRHPKLNQNIGKLLSKIKMINLRTIKVI